MLLLLHKIVVIIIFLFIATITADLGLVQEGLLVRIDVAVLLLLIIILSVRLFDVFTQLLHGCPSFGDRGSI